ncbi:hypothetical protein RFI_04414 [Reticulomyxa filosa]|uniref:Uncharacterized protein n=1 Tax=Reticulomyxa filosa TaxID=46433 RepID=X6P3N9_RETFI|nr:hypothetical protein RFI_04414 [Reticulomyxa filosa]|eukprot:ETO32704.1 hypothetical protein RFI_04414 [Reticulomyxa filosa]
MSTFQPQLQSPLVYQIAPTPKGNCVSCFDVDEKHGWLISGQMSGTINAWKLPKLRSDPFKILNKSRAQTKKGETDIRKENTNSLLSLPSSSSVNQDSYQATLHLASSSKSDSPLPSTPEINGLVSATTIGNEENGKQQQQQQQDQQEIENVVSSSVQLRTTITSGMTINRYHRFECRNLVAFAPEMVQQIRVVPSLNGKIIAMIGFNSIKTWKNILSSDQCDETINLKNMLSEFNINGTESLMVVCGSQYLRIFCPFHKKFLEMDMLYDPNGGAKSITKKSLQLVYEQDEEEEENNNNNNNDKKEEKEEKRTLEQSDTKLTSPTTITMTTTIMASDIKPSGNSGVYFCQMDDELSKDCPVINGSDDYLLCYTFKKKWRDKNNTFRGTYIYQSLEVKHPPSKNPVSPLYELKQIRTYEKQNMYRRPRNPTNSASSTASETQSNTSVAISVSDTFVVPNTLIDVQETSWGFLVDGDTMAYVVSTKSNVIRVVRWTDQSDEKSVSANKVNDNAGPAQVLYEYNNGKRGFIVTMEYKHGFLVTLSSDRRLCIYHKNVRIAMATNLPGTFIPGYAYIIKRSENAPNVLYYTADEGIFVVEF